MSVNPISQDLTALKIHPVPTSEVKTAQVMTSVNEQGSLRQAAQTSQTNSAKSIQNNTSISQNKPLTDATNSALRPDRAMNHVVETYNQQGELLIKFVDSNNNTLYQIPSEMEVRMKELIGKQETSANTTG